MKKKLPNWGKYTKRIKQISTKVLIPNGDDVIVGIIRRTQSGKDVNNKSFKKYSKNYDKKGTVTLTDKGSMLHSISVKKITGGIRLYFNNTNENTKAYANQKSRKFFGLDKKQISILTKKVGKFINP